MLRRKFKRRRRVNKPLKTRQVFFITIIVFTLISIASVIFVNKTVEPVLMNIARQEINRISIEAIHESVEKNMEKIDMNQFIIMNENGDAPPSYSINPKASNTLRAAVTKDIQETLNLVKTNPFVTSAKAGDDQFKNAVYYIPLGVVTGNSLLAHYGPKIPVKMAAIGSVESDFKTDFTSTGINNVLLKLTVSFKVNMQIVIPTLSEQVVVKHNFDAGGILYNGGVPTYYSAGSGMIAPAVVDEKSP